MEIYMNNGLQGNLVIIGGAEEKHGNNEILKTVVSIVGGKDAYLLVLTTATQNPQEVGKEYRMTFENLGIKNIDILNIDSKFEANNDDNLAKINKSTGIFFTGGDQLRITSILGGTKLYQALKQSYLSGTSIIGTSAGASVMSNTMITAGLENEPARKCTLKMAPGLGLLEEVIIDQHFAQRGRIGRLLCSVAQNPDILGIGIDENTAIQVFPDQRFKVIGSNSVTVIDGKSILNSNVSEQSPNEILAIANVTLHVLPKGYGYHIKDRQVLNNLV
jgi:cyanophycinase